jgi:hypothetical protein
MAENHKINWEKLAAERLAGKSREQQLKEQRDSKRSGSKTEVKTTKLPESTGEKPNTAEKRKVKNQAEIDDVRRENERIIAENKETNERRGEIKYAVEGALKLVAKKLQDKHLSEKQRARLKWVEKSAKNAYNHKDLRQGKYPVEVQDGNRVESREEGLPTEGLMWEVASEIKYLDREIQLIDRIPNLRDKAKINSLDEVTKKREWYKIFQELPESDLKKKIFRRMEEWRNTDEYDQVQTESQLGEACFEIIRDLTDEHISHLKQQANEGHGIKEQIEDLKGVLSTLAAGSEKYFYQHYHKLSSELTEAEKEQQHKYTKREANLIAKDADYRGLLLDRYKKKLPAGFESMNREKQDYELAMVALENRRVLNLPQLKDLKPEPEPEYEDEVKKAEVPVGSKPVTSERVKPGAVPEKHILQNSNKPDERSNFENSAMGVPDQKHKLQNPNELYDLENLAMTSRTALKETEKTIATEQSKKPEKLFLIDISEIAKRMAWTKAEEKLQKEFKDANFFKRAWKGLSENYKRIKYYEEAFKEIQNDNNLMKAISERAAGQSLPGNKGVSAEYLGLLDKTVAEYEHDVVDSQREIGDIVKDDPIIQSAVAELLYRHANNNWDQFGGEYKNLKGREAVEFFVKDKIIPLLAGKQWSNDPHQQSEKKGLLFASNFWGIAEKYKDQILKQTEDAKKEYGEKYEKEVLQHLQGTMNLELQLGYKDRDLVNNRPKGILKAYERLANWGEDHRVLGKILLNPFMIGVGSVVVSRAGQRVMKWGAVGAAAALGATGFWVPIGAGALAGGLYRSWKRSKDVSYDQAQELRHQTLGGKASEVLGKNGERGYGKAIKSFKEALAEVAAMQGKKTFTDAEKLQLAQIYARLQLERGFLQDRDNKFTKVDLFQMEEEAGKRYGTTAVDKSTLRVELKKLGISEHELQGLIDAQKGEILNTIRDVNKLQDSFRRREMWKAGAMGAVMGLAGAVLAQEAIHLGGEQVEKLWGGHYFKSHGTNFNRIQDWVKGSHIYQSHFGHGAAVGATADHAVGGLWHSREATSHEWMEKIKDHISGGQVEHVHTQDFYDNNTTGQSATEHLHNANELKFFINKDSGGNIHFKVPVEQGGSWVIHGNRFQEADLDKGFADGRIKMIFMPDDSGHGAHEAITFQINPATNEVIIPQDSNIRNLFDEATGMPKNGSFGLAEQVGTNKDGSTIYNWINSLRGHSGHIDYGHVSIQDHLEPGALATEQPHDYYSPTIPTVPPQRKVFLRPEERAKAEEKQKKQEEEKAKKKAERDAKKKSKSKADSHSSSGHAESGGGGGSSEGAKKATGEKEPGVKVPEFTKDDVQKRYLNQKYAAALLKRYESHPDGLAEIDKKSVQFAIEGDKHKGSIDRPLTEDMAKAVWELEQALVVGKIISQKKADQVYGELSEPPPVEKPAPKAAAGGEKPAPKGAKKGGTESAEPDDNAEEKETPEEKGGELVKERRELEAKWGKKFNVKVPGNADRRKLAAGALENLGRALNRAEEKSVRTALDKKFGDKEKSGLYVEFVKPGDVPKFENGVLVLPVDAGPVEILKALKATGIERRAAKSGTEAPKRRAKT